MSWRIIYIEENDYLSLYLDNIKIRRADHEVIVPLSDVATIMIDNLQTTVTASLVSKCAEYNVDMIICNHLHLPQSIVLPISSNYRASAILHSQMNWSDSFRGTLWQEIVRKKIMRQADVLTAVGKTGDVRNRLFRFIEETQLLDKGNCEGLSAKMYFRELFGLDFYRDENSPVNSALNYGYSIVRSQISRSLVAHGFNPHIGIFHRGQGNTFNLADDIIEPFRPIIDLWVYEHMREEKMFVREHRLQLISLITKKFLLDKKYVTLIFAIEKVVESLYTLTENGSCDQFIFPEVTAYDI